MKRILVLYQSRYGQTKKISQQIAEELRFRGFDVVLSDVGGKGELPMASAFDGVVSGAPVYKGSLSSSLRKWVSRNQSALASLPTAFFSVCLGILETENIETQLHERQIMRNFLAAAGWRPNLIRIFAGGLPYTRYNWLIRWTMKRIAKSAGGDTDTRRDYEYTDWSEVRAFSQALAALFSADSAPSAHILRPMEISQLATM